MAVVKKLIATIIKSSHFHWYTTISQCNAVSNFMVKVEKGFRGVAFKKCLGLGTGDSVIGTIGCSDGNSGHSRYESAMLVTLHFKKKSENYQGRSGASLR